MHRSEKFFLVFVELKIGLGKHILNDFSMKK